MKTSLSRRQFVQSGLFGIAGLTLLPFSMHSQAQAVRGGKLAPELDVPYWIDGQGKPQDAFSIHANRGKWIYLKCFQEWCPSCHSVGFPNLQKLVAAFPDNEHIVSAVIQTTFEGGAANTKDALRKNQLRYNLDLPFGHDEGNLTLPKSDPHHYPTTMTAYQTGGTPWVVVINPEGEIMFNDFHIDMDKLIAFLKTQFV
jgi:thiol-disulfide isomerase/thioredoxin